MPGTDPNDTFREAREACRTLDWEGLYACLVLTSVTALATNSLQVLSRRTEALDTTTMKRLCLEADTDTSWVDEWAARRAQIQDSHTELRAGGSVGEDVRKLSVRHRTLVVQDKRETERALRELPELRRLAAALEREMRQVLGGGSVSSRLFVDETLHDVVVAGNRATGLRRTARGHEMGIEFEKVDGRWFIQVP